MTHWWRAHRAKLIAVLIVATVAASATILVNRSRTQGNEPSTRVETRSVGPAGQSGPIDVIVPNYPSNPGQPQTKGPYRLLPFGYFDPPVATAPSPKACAHSTVDPSDAAVVKSAKFYAEPRYIPAGFAAAVHATIVCGTEVQEIQWTLQSASSRNSAEITIGPRDLPIDIRIPPEDSWVRLEEGTINNLPAIFLRNKPGQGGPQGIILVRQGITIDIGDNGVDFDELIKIASSLQ